MPSFTGRKSARTPLHRQFRLEACAIAIDRSDRERASAALVSQQAILRGDIAVHRDFVPFLGVTDIVDRHIVMLAPEERHGFEYLARSQHVARGGLALALGHHPVFDTDGLPGMRIRPARN